MRLSLSAQAFISPRSRPSQFQAVMRRRDGLECRSLTYFGFIFPFSYLPFALFLFTLFFVTFNVFSLIFILVFFDFLMFCFIIRLSKVFAHLLKLIFIFLFTFVVFFLLLFYLLFSFIYFSFSLVSFLRSSCFPLSIPFYNYFILLSFLLHPPSFPPSLSFIPPFLISLFSPVTLSSPLRLFSHPPSLSLLLIPLSYSFLYYPSFLIPLPFYLFRLPSLFSFNSPIPFSLSLVLFPNLSFMLSSPPNACLPSSSTPLLFLSFPPFFLNPRSLLYVA